MKTGAVVLCAGGGTRFHAPGAGHKLLAPFRGRPLVSWALESAVAAELGPVVAVSGAVALGGAVPAGVVVVHNPEWAQGLATSLQRALALGAELGLDAVVVGLGDQPLVPSSAWRAVAGSPAPVAVATYGDRRGNPVKLARGVWADLPATGDEGGRALMRLRPELVEEVPCEGEPFDVDTLEDLGAPPGGASPATRRRSGGDGKKTRSHLRSRD